VDDSEIGARIKSLRKARKLTLTQVQELSGINNGNLSKIERGLQSLTNTSIRNLAKALGVSPAEIFTEGYAQSAGLTHNSAAGAGRNFRDVREYENLSSIPQDENVAIAAIQVRPDVAHGGVTFGQDPSKSHVFYGGDIAKLKTEPSNLLALQIEDDLMQPRLYKGDEVVISLEDKDIPASGGVFAVVLDDETVVVRRLLPYPNKGMRIVCDNPAYNGTLDVTLNAQQASRITIAGRLKHSRSLSGF
jgi:transcriptional regulator with XRE-family HTH domain